MPPLDWSQGHVFTTTSPRFLQHSTGFQCARELCSRLWCWCGSVLTHCSRLLLRTLRSCCLCFRSSASQVSLDGPTTSFKGPNLDRLAELRCRGTISVEQSSCCSTETRDDSAHFQETTEDLSVPHNDVLVNRRNSHYHPALLWPFRDSGAGYKTADLLTYLLTYLLTNWQSIREAKRLTMMLN